MQAYFYIFFKFVQYNRKKHPCLTHIYVLGKNNKKTLFSVRLPDINTEPVAGLKDFCGGTEYRTDSRLTDTPQLFKKQELQWSAK